VWPFISASEVPSADTLAARQLIDAAHAKANADAYGSAVDQAAANNAFAVASQANAARVAALQVVEAQPSFLDSLKDFAAGFSADVLHLAIVAAIVLVGVYLFAHRKGEG
jgi:O-acetyl-ADP-ribose deacetylase (regulator of RNase III)